MAAVNQKSLVHHSVALFLNKVNSLIFIDILHVAVFSKTIIPLALVGHEVIIANSALHALLAIYHLISNARSWNNPVKYIVAYYFAAACLTNRSKFRIA